MTHTKYDDRDKKQRPRKKTKKIRTYRRKYLKGASRKKWTNAVTKSLEDRE